MQRHYDKALGRFQDTEWGVSGFTVLSPLKPISSLEENFVSNPAPIVG